MCKLNTVERVGREWGEGRQAVPISSNLFQDLVLARLYPGWDLPPLKAASSSRPLY